MQKKIIIIGGGLAGLSAACLAVQRGFRVDLYEKESKLGGVCRSESIGKFRFDLSPKLFPAPYLLDALIKNGETAQPISSQFISTSPAAQFTFSDAKRMVFTVEQDPLAAQWESRGLLPIKMDRAFEKMDQVLLEMLDSTSGKKKSLWQRIQKVKGIQLQQPLSSFLQEMSTDPYLQQICLILSAQAGTKISALQVRDLFLPALIRKSGVFYPSQGWDEIIQSLQQFLIQAGGKIFTQTRVIEDLASQKNIVGVRLADQSLQWADGVLNTASSLTPEEFQAQMIQPTIYFHFGIRNSAELEALPYHSIYILNGNYKTWSQENKISSTWRPDYLHIFHLDQPQPEGCQMLSIQVPLPTFEIGYQEKEWIRQSLLTFLEKSVLPGLKPSIEMEYIEWSVEEKLEKEKIPASEKQNSPPNWLSAPSKMVHLQSFFNNRKPTLAEMLYALQRWIESPIA